MKKTEKNNSNLKKPPRRLKSYKNGILKNAPRGTLVQKVYDENMPQRLLDLMKEGGSAVEFCAEIDITDKAFISWCLSYPDFRLAYDIGKRYHQAYYEKWLRTNLDNPKANSALYKLYTGHYFGFSDKQEIKSENTHDMSPEVKEALEQLKKAYQKPE